MRLQQKIKGIFKATKRSSSSPQYPNMNDPGDWHTYWQKQNQPWRTEPEIDTERQKFLEARCAIVPDIKQGIFPFRGIKLNRSDVEWLLARRYKEYGPLNYVSGAGARGIDLRGAILCGVDLSRLPLAQIRGSLRAGDWSKATNEQREAAAIHLEGANLYRADLTLAILRSAHLEGANLKYAHLEGTHLNSAYLEGNEQFPSAANLQHVSFDHETNLEDIAIGNKTYGFIQLADIDWNNVNIAVVNWSLVDRLGDEYKARASKQVNDYHAAVRANRQLNVALQSQGMNEEAEYFAYRAQVMQRHLFWRRFRESGRSWQLRWNDLRACLFSMMLDVLSGYGYRLGRTLLWYSGILLLFMWIYLQISLGLPPDVHSPDNLGWVDALILSISSLVGRGFFRQDLSLSDPYAGWSVLEGVIGVFMDVLLISTLTQRLFKK